MTRIYLVRHAEAEGNLYRRAHGHFDGLITGRGDLQIEQLRQRFMDEKIDAVYSSDLFRTRKTAEAIYKPKALTLITDTRLREVNVGCWEDMPWGDIEYNTPEQSVFFNGDPARWKVDGSEDFYSVRTRMTECLSELARSHSGETIAVFTHGFAIRAFLSGLLGIQSHEIRKIPYCDNTAAALLLYDGAGFTVEYHGDNSHLLTENSTFAHQRWWRGGGAGRENLRFMPLDKTRGMELSKLPGTETKNPGDTVLMALAGEEPVGILGLDTGTSGGGAGVISHIFILPEFRRQGFGVQLIGQALSEYRKLGYKKLCLTVPENSPAAGFCQKYGFRRTEAYREGMQEDLVTMEKDISFHEK